MSKDCREIAAANLYRELSVIFPDEDDFNVDTWNCGLASYLDTFATSDYNYAQFLKIIELYTLVGGDKAEKACQQYTFDTSCGKFMNTYVLNSRPQTLCLL